MPIEVIIMMIGMGLGAAFSCKSSYGVLAAKKKEGEQKGWAFH